MQSLKPYSQVIFAAVMFKFVPHLITSGNLFCGVLAILALGRGEFFLASNLVILAGVLDFFDGFAARIFKVDGDFGKQLDSLADVITFGLVPGLYLYHTLLKLNEWPFEMSYPTWLVFIPLLIPVFSALRLAKFNIDTEQSSSFIGLPTPANAFWIMSLPYFMEEFNYLELMNPYVLVAWALLSCFLLVSPLKLMALKVKGFGWKENASRYIFLLICLILLVVFKFASLSIIIPFYILYSLLLKFTSS